MYAAAKGLLTSGARIWAIRIPTLPTATGSAAWALTAPALTTIEVRITRRSEREYFIFYLEN
jgi:hypothetical protein